MRLLYFPDTSVLVRRERLSSPTERASEINQCLPHGIGVLGRVMRRLSSE